MEYFDGYQDPGEIDWFVEPNEAKCLGGGAYGDFYLCQKHNLPYDWEYAGFKVGTLGKEEIPCLKLASDKGAAPLFYAARTKSIKDPCYPNLGRVIGQIAMETVSNGSEDVVDNPDHFWVALSKIHKIGIAHGDLHEGNIVVTDCGKPYVIDFGLATIDWLKCFQEALSFALMDNDDAYDGEWFSCCHNAELARINARAIKKILAERFEMDARTIDSINYHIPDRDAKKFESQDFKHLVNLLYMGIK